VEKQKYTSTPRTASSQAYTERRMPNHDQSYLLAHKIDDNMHRSIQLIQAKTQKLTLAMASDLQGRYTLTTRICRVGTEQFSPDNLLNNPVGYFNLTLWFSIRPLGFLYRTDPRLNNRILVPKTPTALIIFMVIYYKTLITTAMGAVVHVQNNPSVEQ